MLVGHVVTAVSVAIDAGESREGSSRVTVVAIEAPVRPSIDRKESVVVEARSGPSTRVVAELAVGSESGRDVIGLGPYVVRSMTSDAVSGSARKTRGVAGGAVQGSVSPGKGEGGVREPRALPGGGDVTKLATGRPTVGEVIGIGSWQEVGMTVLASN